VAHQRAVTLGRVVGSDYVVLSGLKTGDKLITSGIQKIGDGAPVTGASGARGATGATGAAGGGR
jgi:membrane fusion protein (multidrug efflux system)